jgi:hypothetical protein
MRAARDGADIQRDGVRMIGHRRDGEYLARHLADRASALGVIGAGMGGEACRRHVIP